MKRSTSAYSAAYAAVPALWQSIWTTPPRKIIAFIKNGFKEEALKSFTIWLCASCYTCQVHCPAKIKKKARYVDVDKCNGCGDCWNNCPTVITPSERIIWKGDIIIKKIEKEH